MMRFWILSSAFCFAQVRASDTELSTKLLWKKGNVRLIETDESWGDYLGQSIQILEGKKKKTLLEYAHPNYDGDSRLKVEDNGDFSFEASDGGPAKVQGKAVNFEKNKITCPKVGVQAVSAGFRVYFNFSHRKLSVPEPICYHF